MKNAFGRKKCIKACLTKVGWVLGEIDRQRKAYFLKVAETKDTHIVSCIIIQHMKPETTEITDICRGYMPNRI